MVRFENHPFSVLSQRIEQLLWASIILSSFIAAVSLVNMGRLSLFVAPCMFLLTLIHNLTLVGLISRDRKKTTPQLADTLAPTASKFAIISSWILVGFWSLVIVVIIVALVLNLLIMTMDEFDGWERLAGYIELPLVAAEVFMLVILATKCEKQRRSTIVQPEHVDWQHFGPPVSVHA